MIELVENLLEITVIALCFIISLHRALRNRQRSWILVTLFYASMLLGNLYWTLYFYFYKKTPQIFYVSELSWCAGFLFILLMLRHFQTDEERAVRSPVLWIIPVFVTAMMFFYFRWGDYLLNIVEAFLMGLMMVRSAQGLIALKDISDGRKTLYRVTLFYCLIEYAVWTSSCFWMGDTIRTLYFWFGVLQMGVLPFFYRAIRKAEAG